MWMCTCFARPVNGCSNKQTSPEWPIFSIVALFYVSLLQVVIWCLMTLHIALSIPFLLPWLTHTHTHAEVCHPRWGEWCLYGRCCWAAQGGHLVFFPSQSLKCKHPSCLDLPNEHLVFQSGLLAVTFFFVSSWSGRQGCSALCSASRLSHTSNVVHHKRVVLETQAELAKQAHTCTCGCTHTDITHTNTRKNALAHKHACYELTCTHHSVILSPGFVFSLCAV